MSVFDRRAGWHFGCNQSVVMTTIASTLLATVSGGGANPAHLQMAGACPALTSANNTKARAWLKANHIGADRGGNYTKIDGPFPSIYRYEYANGSRCAPGADD